MDLSLPSLPLCLWASIWDTGLSCRSIEDADTSQILSSTRLRPQPSGLSSHSRKACHFWGIWKASLQAPLFLPPKDWATIWTHLNSFFFYDAASKCNWRGKNKRFCVCPPTGKQQFLSPSAVVQSVSHVSQSKTWCLYGEDLEKHGVRYSLF